jgi:hypothetical protein
MNTTFENVILKSELTQSDSYGEFYETLMENIESATFCSPLENDVAETLNCILMKYNTLTQYQKDMLFKIFNAFNNICVDFDPNRLKPFDHCFTPDDELLLYRQSESGLINILINSEECIAFSFIPNKEGQRKFYLIYDEGDFEKLVYDFFS